jgi:hypothetical protein
MSKIWLRDFWRNSDLSRQASLSGIRFSDFLSFPKRLCFLQPETPTRFTTFFPFVNYLIINVDYSHFKRKGLMFTYLKDFNKRIRTS